MTDAPPPTRRILVRGLALDRVEALVGTYQELDDPGDVTHTLTLRGPNDAGWVQLDVPDALEDYHLYNLAKWLEGSEPDDPAPSALLVVDQGDDPYWLQTVSADGGSTILAGRYDDHRRLTYDLAQVGPVDDARFDASPMSVAMAMRTSGVPTAMQSPGGGPPVSRTLSFRPWPLDGDGASPFVMKVLGWIFGKS